MEAVTPGSMVQLKDDIALWAYVYSTPGGVYRGGRDERNVGKLFPRQLVPVVSVDPRYDVVMIVVNDVYGWVSQRFVKEIE